MRTASSLSPFAATTPQKPGTPFRDAAKNVAGNAGLAALVAFETPVHETIHCGTAMLSPAVQCGGVTLSTANNWYLKPLEYLTLGFYSVGDTGQADGLTQILTADSFAGHLGGIAASAMPEFVYTTLGMALVKNGMEQVKTKPVQGMYRTLIGGLCMSSTLDYMRVSFFGAQPGHDYYNVTATVLDMVGLPEFLAGVLTPLVGIPMLFGGAYFAASWLTDLAKPKAA